MASYWRNRSRSVILAALKDGRAKGLEGRALEKHVQAAYPFGEREMHRNKIWLDEFSALVRGVRKTMSGGRARGPKLLGEWPMTDEQREALEG